MVFKRLIGGDKMEAELRNQALVAAELARQSGFDETYKALLSLAGELFKEKTSQSDFIIRSKLV